MSAWISSARWAATVSVEKYGMPAPAPKITTRPFSRCRIARSGMYGSATWAIVIARLHPGLDALLLQEVLQREAVHHGAEHAHVVGAGPVHAALLQLGAAEEVAAADHHGDLHAAADHGGDLPGDAPARRPGRRRSRRRRRPRRRASAPPGGPRPGGGAVGSSAARLRVAHNLRHPPRPSRRARRPRRVTAYLPLPTLCDEEAAVPVAYTGGLLVDVAVPAGRRRAPGRWRLRPGRPRTGRSGSPRCRPRPAPA